MDPEKALLGKYSAERLQEKIERKIDDFQGLLTREAALKLLANEEGLLQIEEKEYAIREIPEGGRGIILKAVLRQMHPEKRYPSGKRSRTVLLADGTGSIPLTLWNSTIDALSRFKAGDSLRLSGAYLKKGELGFSSQGRLELLEAADFHPLSVVGSEGKEITVRGRIVSVEPVRTYRRHGEERRMVALQLADGERTVRCVWWEAGERAARFQVEDELILENVKVRNGELHTEPRSRLLHKKQPGARRGIVKDIGSEGERLRVELESGTAMLERPEALRLLGVEAAPDIALATLATLKKDTLVNTRVDLDEGR